MAQIGGFAYIYADPHAAASSWKPVHCDGSLVAKIKNGHFFSLTVTSGQYTCAIAGDTPSSVLVDPNQDAFLRVDEHVIIGESKVLILTPVAAAVASKEMQWLSYIPTKKVLATNVSVADRGTPAQPKFKTRQKDQ